MDNSIWQNAQNNFEKEFDFSIQQNNHDELEKNFEFKVAFNLMKFKESKIKIVYGNQLGEITQYLLMKLWLKKTILKLSVNLQSLKKNPNERIFT